MTDNATNRRWVNVTGLCIDGVSFHDIIGASISVDCNVIGSNSESDTYDNHYIQSSQANATITFRSYDVSAAMQLLDSIGEVVDAEYVLTLGSGSSAGGTKGKDITFQALSDENDGGIVITRVSIPGEHDTESVCEVQATFRSNGQNVPWHSPSVS